MFYFSALIVIKARIKKNRQLSYNRADYTAMREFVNSRLSHMDLSGKSASRPTLWSHLNEVMQNAMDLFHKDQLRICTENYCG